MPTVDTGNLKHWLNHAHQSHSRINWDIIDGKPYFWYITDGSTWAALDKKKEIFDLSTGRVRFEDFKKDDLNV